MQYLYPYFASKIFKENYCMFVAWTTEFEYMIYNFALEKNIFDCVFHFILFVYFIASIGIK